jgi:hypothetical protein
MLSPIPAPAHLEKYARELQHSWLSGKIYPVWTKKALAETIPSEQVVSLILFQVDVHILKHFYDLKLWDMQDGQILEQLGLFLFQAHEKVSIPHVQIASILHQATYQSLLMLLHPNQSLYSFFFQHRKALNLLEFSFYSRYITYFDFVPAALVSYAQRQGLLVIDEALWQEKFDRILKVYEEETQESIESYQQRALERFTRQQWGRVQERWQHLIASEDQVITDILSSGGEEDVIRNLFGTSPGTGAGGDTAQAHRNPLLSAVEYEPRQILAARFQEQPRRADILKRFDIEAIPVHKQFVFIQRVFEGDVEAFQMAIDQLNTVRSTEEVQDLIRKWISQKTDPQAAEEFRQWVLSRFAQG